MISSIMLSSNVLSSRMMSSIMLCGILPSDIMLNVMAPSHYVVAVCIASFVKMFIVLATQGFQLLDCFHRLCMRLNPNGFIRGLSSNKKRWIETEKNVFKCQKNSKFEPQQTQQLSLLWSGTFFEWAATNFFDLDIFLALSISSRIRAMPA